MNSGSVTNIKVWPLDANGDPISDRPSYQCFPVAEEGFWVIRRDDNGWRAWFHKDDE